MTTLEKLFAQIFERKDRIIEQVQQQADSYTQHLASRLLIDGITPPPWLLSPNFNSHSSDPNELEKEEIISKLLLRPPRASTRYSSGGCSLYYQPVVAGGNERLANEMCMGTHAPNKDLSVSNEPMVTLELCNNDIVSSLNHIASEVDDSVNSPQYEVDARISSIYAAPDTSLARIQRSKSRQKARELRTNVKPTAKSCLSDENRTLISTKGDSTSNSDLHQVTQDKRPSDMGKCNNISEETSMSAEEKGNKGTDRTSHSGRLRKFSNSHDNLSFLNDHPKNGSSSEKEALEDGILVHPTGNPLQQSGHVNGVMEGVNLPDVYWGSYTGKKSITVKTQATERQNKPLCGRITRSKSSSQQSSGINKSSELVTSSSCHRQEGGGALSHCVGDLIHEHNTSNKLSVTVETSQMLSDRIGEIQAISSNGGELKQVTSSNIAVKESPLGAKQQENAKVHAENGPIDAPVLMQHVSSGSKFDPVTLCPKLEGLASQSSDCCMIVKPKQLNFDEISECDLNEICSPLSKKRKLDGLSGQKCYPSNESALSVDHKANSTSFEQQLLKANVSSCSPKAERMLSHNNIDDYAKEATKNIDLGMNENPFMKDVERNSKVSLRDDIDVICEVNASPKEVNSIVDEEMHTGKSQMNEDHASSIKMQIKEGDLGHKGEESAAVVYIPVSGSAKSLFISSLTKQRNKDLEEDLRFSKSKDSEVGTHPKLSNIKMNSGKVTTWPLNRQRNFEDQLNCFSDSRGFRVHIQRDAIRCDLEEPKSDSHSFRESTSVFSSEEIRVSQSDGIQNCDERVPGEMIGDLADGSESLLELQAAEAAVTEVDNNTTETCVLKLIKNAADDSTYSLAADVGASNLSSNDDVAVTENESLEISLPECVSHMEFIGLSSNGSVRSSRNNDKTMVVFDEIMPVYEGFVIDEEVGNVTMENPECGVDFDTLENTSTTIARASILEQICKSASMETPVSQFSSTFEQHQISDLYGFMAGGIPEHIDTGTTVSLNENSRQYLQTSDSAITEVDSDFSKQHKFDSFPSAATPCYWQSKSHYSSPVGKLWERSGSSSGSSEKQLSSNPELTCFPIEEDPNSNEESENAEETSDELQENMISKVENENTIRISPKTELERREDDDEVAVEKELPHEYIEACSQHVNPESTSMKHPDRYSSNSGSITRTRDNVKYKPKNYQGIKISRYEEENRASSIATRASSRGNVSEFSKNKSSTRNRIPRSSQKEAKRNNIVSNITSFIPIVKQKQAAAGCTGKREIKVKALEAAEAAKRREQEKENERKMKKEALKLERARIGKENAKEMELNKKKKQEELKKKEADLAARKRQRQREEDERKQVAKKRKLVAEAQKIQKLKYEKSRVGKVELEKQQGKNAANAGNKKVSENLRQNTNADENSFQKQDSELGTDKLLASAVQQVASVPENFDASNDSFEKEKTTSIHEKSPVKVGPVWSTPEENSYDISPYQCSDDEDDEEDDLPTKKFVPSWASKSRVAMVLPLQQNLDPESIFSVESFCSMDEVLLPRRLQAQ